MDFLALEKLHFYMVEKIKSLQDAFVIHDLSELGIDAEILSIESQVLEGW